MLCWSESRKSLAACSSACSRAPDARRGVVLRLAAHGLRLQLGVLHHAPGTLLGLLYDAGGLRLGTLHSLVADAVQQTLKLLFHDASPAHARRSTEGRALPPSWTTYQSSYTK